MLRTLPLILLAAWLLPACEGPDVTDDFENWPAPSPRQYVYRDPRVHAWRTFEESGPFRPLVQPARGGLIEWTSGTVVGEGRGLARSATPQEGLMARRAARLVAARNALLAASGIAVGPGGVFHNASSGTVQLEATLRDFQEIRSDYNPATRTAVSAVRVPLYGARGIVRIAGLDLREPARPWAWPTPRADEPAGDPSPAARDEAPQILVVDLRRTGFSPVLLPRFLTPDGQCVFDAAELGVEELSWRPAATYMTFSPPPDGGVHYATPDSATDGVLAWCASTSFQKPLVVGNCKVRAGAVVLSEATVNYLRSHPRVRELFRSGQVVIVVDPAAR